MNELESHLQAPTATPDQIEHLVESLASSTVDAPRKLSHGLVVKLEAIAVRRDGKVPIHGRLFAQWLHYAFPNECPYPHQYSLDLLRPGRISADDMLVTPAEKAVLIKATNATDFVLPSMSLWS